MPSVYGSLGQGPSNWSHRQLCTAQCGCWDVNFVPLEGKCSQLLSHVASSQINLKTTETQGACPKLDGLKQLKCVLQFWRAGVDLQGCLPSGVAGGGSFPPLPVVPHGPSAGVTQPSVPLQVLLSAASDPQSCRTRVHSNGLLLITSTKPWPYRNALPGNPQGRTYPKLCSCSAVTPSQA